MACYWLIWRYGGSLWTWVCVCVCVAIGSSAGKCKDSACAINASTSGVYMLICSDLAPPSMGSSCASMLVSDGAGVHACDRASEHCLCSYCRLFSRKTPKTNKNQ